MASTVPARSTAARNASAAPSKSRAAPTRWQVIERASSAAISGAASSGRPSATMAQVFTAAVGAGSGAGSSKIRRSAGSHPGARLSGLRLGEGAGNEGGQECPQRGGTGGAHDLHQPGLVHDGDLGAAGEDDLARAPAERVLDEVGAEGAELVGAGHRVEG